MMTSCKIRTQSSEFAWYLSLHSSELHRYDFEYDEDDEQETGDVDVENKYYNAKQMKAENPEEAIVEFLGLPALEEEKGDWSVSSYDRTSKAQGVGV
jgi:COP9 signalosome complex subunit 2